VESKFITSFFVTVRACAFRYTVLEPPPTRGPSHGCYLRHAASPEKRLTNNKNEGKQNDIVVVLSIYKQTIILASCSNKNPVRTIQSINQPSHSIMIGPNSVVCPYLHWKGMRISIPFSFLGLPPLFILPTQNKKWSIVWLRSHGVGLSTYQLRSCDANCPHLGQTKSSNRP
jgi:hypothetical protein